MKQTRAHETKPKQPQNEVKLSPKLTTTNKRHRTRGKTQEERTLVKIK
jgi:hypothetical protein